MGIKKITYAELCKNMYEFNKTHNWSEESISGVIVFTEDSFNKIYPLESRSYGVSSNNKAWIPGMCGYSIYASSLDKTDRGVRLEQYIDVEYGGKNGWHVDYCYMTDKEGNPIEYRV